MIKTQEEGEGNGTVTAGDAPVVARDTTQPAVMGHPLPTAVEQQAAQVGGTSEEQQQQPLQV